MTHGCDNPLNNDSDATKVFDGTVNTKWTFQKAGDYPWVAWTFLDNRREVANVYDLSNAEDSNALDPKRWKVYGSNDAETWVLLDERIDVSWTQRMQTRRYTMDNTIAYHSYKFEFIENCENSPEVELFQISEWTILSDHSSIPPPDSLSFIYDPFLFGDTTNYRVQGSTATDMEALEQYLAVRDAHPTMALQNTRVIALSGMTLEGAELFETSLSRQVKSAHPIDLYFYSDKRLGHSVNATIAIPLLSLSEFTSPSRIVFGDGLMKREGMAAVIQWLVDNRELGYFVNLEYFQISGHKAASFEGSEEEALALQSQIVANLHTMCTDKTNFPKLKTMIFNDNAYNEFNNGLDAAIRGACDREMTGVTVRAYQVNVWYPPMCSASNPDNYSYYDRDDEKEMAQCRFTWNWEMGDE